MNEKQIIIILVYLLGYVLAYRYCRSEIKKIDEGQWTVGDRMTALLLSLGSWISIFGVWLSSYTDRKNQPANW